LGLGTENRNLRKFGFVTTNAAFSSGVATVALKLILNVKRPDGNKRSRFDSSFPSGHAMGTAALAGTVHQQYGFKYAVPFQLASLFSGLTRLFDHQHRPSEVFAGWGLGYAIGYGVGRAWENLSQQKTRFSITPWRGFVDRRGTGTQIILPL
jgi:membrane-associated phospholipid phosphatase